MVKRDLNFSGLLQTAGLQKESDLNPSLWSKTAEQYFLDPVSKSTTKQDKQVTFKTPVETRLELQDTTYENLYINPNEINSPKKSGGDHTYESLTQLQTKTKPFEIVPESSQNESYSEDIYGETMGFRRNRNRMLSRDETSSHTDISSSNLNNKNLPDLKDFDKYESLRLPETPIDAYIDVGELSQNNNESFEENPYIVQKTSTKSIERDTYIEFEKYQNFVDRNVSMTKTLQYSDLERDKGVIEVSDYEVTKQLDNAPFYDSKRGLGNKLSKDNTERNFSNNTDKESNQEFKNESGFIEDINSPCQYELDAAIKRINAADKEEGHRLDTAVESDEFITESEGIDEEFESCNEFMSEKQDYYNTCSTQVAQIQNSSSNNSDSETKGNSSYDVATLGASEEVLYDTPYTSSKDETQNDGPSQTSQKYNTTENHKSKELLEEINNALLSKSTVNIRSESLDEKMDRWREYSTRFINEGLEQEDYLTSYTDREFVKKGDKINRNVSTQPADPKMKHYGATNASFNNAGNNNVSIKNEKNVPENTSTSKSVVCRELKNDIPNESKHQEVSGIKKSLNQQQTLEEPSHIKVDTLEDDYSSSNEKEDTRNWNHGDQTKTSNKQRCSRNTGTISSSGSHEETRATNAKSSSTATAMATMQSSHSIYRMIPLLFDEPIPESRTSLIFGTSRNSFTIPENERRSWDGNITPTNCESDNIPKDCEKEESLLFVPAKGEITEDIYLEDSENLSKFDQSKNKERARSKAPLVRMLARVARVVQRSGSKPKDFKNDLIVKDFEKNIVQLVNASEKQAKTRVGLPDISSKNRESQTIARGNAEVLNTLAEISNASVHGKRETDVIKVETKTETQRNPQPNYKATENLSERKKLSLKKVTFSPGTSMSSFSSTNHPISINDPVERATKNQGVNNSKIRKEQSSKELATLASFNNYQKSLQHESCENIKNANQALRNNENSDGNQIGPDSSVKTENKSISIQDSKHGKNKKTLDVSDNAGQTQQLTDTINATKPHHCVSGSYETSSSSLGIASMFSPYSSWNIHASFDEKTQRQYENQETVIKKSQRVDARGQKTVSNIESKLFIPIKSGATEKNLTCKKEHVENSKVVDNVQTPETLDNSFFHSEFKECQSNDFKQNVNNSGKADHENGTFTENSSHDKELIEGKLNLQEKTLGKPLQSATMNKDIESGSGCQLGAGSPIFRQEDLLRKHSPHGNLDFQTLENVKGIEENVISNEGNENKLNSFPGLNKKRYTEKFESQDHRRKKHNSETSSNSVPENGQVNNHTKGIENRPLKKSFAKRVAKVFNRPITSEKHFKENKTQKDLFKENMRPMQEVVGTESIKKVKDPKKIKGAMENKQMIMENKFSSNIPLKDLVAYKKEELIANEKVEGANEFNDITPTANRVDVSVSPLFEKQANDNMKEMKKSTKKFWKKIKKRSSKEYLPPSTHLTSNGHQKGISQTSNPARQPPTTKVLEVPIMKLNTKEHDRNDIKMYNLSNGTMKPNDNPPKEIPSREVNVSVINGNMKQKDLSKESDSNNEASTCKNEAKTSMKESINNVTLTASFGTHSSSEVFQNDSRNPSDLSLRNIPLPSHSMLDAYKIDIQLGNSNFSEKNKKVNVYSKLNEKLNENVNSDNSLAKIPVTPESSMIEQTKVSNLIPSLPEEEETLVIGETNDSPIIKNSKHSNSDKNLTSEDTNQRINQVRDLIKEFVESKLLEMQRNQEFTLNQHTKKEKEVISSFANELSSFFDKRNIGNPEAYFTECITVPNSGDSLQVNAAESQQLAWNISKTGILPEYTFEKQTSNPNIAVDSINRLLMQSIASLYEKRSNDSLYDTSHTFNDIEKSIPSKVLSSKFSVVARNSYGKLIPRRSSGIKRKTLHENLIYSIRKAEGDAAPEQLVSKRVRQLQNEQISSDGKCMRHYRKEWKPLPTKLTSKTSITRSKELRKGHQKSVTDVHESLLPKESSYTFDLDKLFESSSHSASSELLETSSNKIKQKTSIADWMSIISKNNVEKMKKNETFTLSTSLSTTEESLESILVSKLTILHPDETERKDSLNVSKYLASSPSNGNRIVMSDELDSDENKENRKIKTGIEKLKEMHKHIPLKNDEKNIKKGSQSNLARLRMLAKVARAVNRLSSGVKDCQDSWKESEKDQNQPQETRNIFIKSEKSRTDTESEQNNASNKELVNVKSSIVDFLDEDVTSVKKEKFHINSSQGLVSKSKDISNELINPQTSKTMRTKKVKRKISEKAISSSSSEKTHVLNLKKDGKAITNFWHTLKRKSSEELFVFAKSKPRQEKKSSSSEANTKSLHPKSQDGTLYLASKKESNIKTIWPPFPELDYSVAKELSDEIRQQLTNSLMQQRVENDMKQRSVSILASHPALTKKHRKLSVTHHRKKEMEPLSSKRQYQLKNEQAHSVGKSVNQQQQVRKIKNPSDTGQLLRAQEKTEDERKHYNSFNDQDKCQNLKGSHITSFDSNTPETEDSQFQRTDIYNDKDEFNELHTPIHELPRNQAFSPSPVYPTKDESISKPRHSPDILFHANRKDNSITRDVLNTKQPFRTSDLHERTNSEKSSYLEQQLNEAAKLLRPIPLPESYGASWERASPKNPAPSPTMRQYGLSIAQELPEALKNLRSTSVPQQPVPNKSQKKEKRNTHPSPLSEDHSARLKQVYYATDAQKMPV